MRAMKVNVLPLVQAIIPLYVASHKYCHVQSFKLPDDPVITHIRSELKASRYYVRLPYITYIRSSNCFSSAARPKY